MNRPDMSETVADDSEMPVTPTTHTFSSFRHTEVLELRARLAEIKRVALRSRARLASGQLPNAAAALEVIAIAAGATLADLKGPREGRWL